MRKRTLYGMLIILLLAGNCFRVFSQEQKKNSDSLDIYEMTLEQLLTIKAHGVPTELEAIINSLISVASKKPLSTRESPSIVSLITAEEIRTSGARDLIDVLRLVPGIDFAMDVYGVIGIGIRGNWAHEGKVLMLVDGMEMNEILYGTNQFGNHFPVDCIKKIEIIRGPGSAIYGGYAEYGVINIITKNGEDINGISAHGTYGQMEKTYGRRNVSLAAGKSFEGGNVSLYATKGQGNRSDQEYTDIYGTSFDMNGNSEINPMNVNLGLNIEGFSFHGMVDQYHTTVRDVYDVARVNRAIYVQDFNSYIWDAKYVLKASDNFSLTTRAGYKYQLPWATATVEDKSDDFRKTTSRLTGSISGSYNFTRKFNIVVGAERFRDVAIDEVKGSYFENGEKTVRYFNDAVFAQSLLKHRLVNIILGARFDNHSDYGSSFSPRIGLTKKIKRLHFKLLYSRAFRAPSIENITQKDSTGIKPETTAVTELETGYQLTRKSILTVNIFDINAKDPIVYYYDPLNNLDRYHNLGKSGSRGIEAEYRIKEKWGNVSLNYSFYSAGSKEKIPAQEVSENKNMLLAFPANKISVSGNYLLLNKINISPSMNYFTERYGYASVDSAGDPLLEKFPSALLLNLFVSKENLFVHGLHAGIGMYDILSQHFKFIQAYNSGHAPLPGPSREVVFKVGYDLNSRKK